MIEGGAAVGQADAQLDSTLRVMVATSDSREKDVLVSAARRRKTWYRNDSARCGGRIEALFHEAVV